MRYVVTELEGYLSGERLGPKAKPGLSVQVVDRAFNHRVCATFRTEEFDGTHERRRELARHRAAEKCAALNGLTAPSIVAMIGGGECRNGHPRTPANTFYRHDGTRRCRECRNASERRKRQRVKDAARDC